MPHVSALCFQQIIEEPGGLLLRRIYLSLFYFFFNGVAIVLRCMGS